MDELLEKILTTDVLNEETKAELSAAFTAVIEERVAEAAAEAEADVRVQLTEQWITERDALIDALDAQVGELLEAELAELRQDIERFRDLEVEYAGKIVEARRELAKELDSDIHALAEQLDEFLHLKLEAELTELKESIDEVRSNELGRKVFEMFAREYKMNYVDKTDVEVKLAEAEQARLAAEAKLTESQTVIEQMQRDSKLAELLAPLSGKQRAMMETVMKSVPTAQLEEGFNIFIGRVLKESSQPAQEGKVLAEGANPLDHPDLAVKTGDIQPEQQPIRESVTVKTNPALAELRALAGISTK